MTQIFLQSAASLPAMVGPSRRREPNNFRFLVFLRIYLCMFIENVMGLCIVFLVSPNFIETLSWFRRTLLAIPQQTGTNHETWRGTRGSRDDRFEPIDNFWFNTLSEMNRPVRQSENSSKTKF